MTDTVLELIQEKVTLHKGNLVFFAGRPGMGKETLTRAITCEIKSKGRKVLIFNEFNRTMHGILSQARNVVAYDDAALDLVVVDFDSIDNAEEIKPISQQLKCMAKDFNCIVIALHTLDRVLEARTDKRPILSDLRDEEIEQNADVIGFLYRDYAYNESTENRCNRHVTELILKKARMGATGTVHLQDSLLVQEIAELRLKIASDNQRLRDLYEEQASIKAMIKLSGEAGLEWDFK